MKNFFKLSLITGVIFTLSGCDLFDTDSGKNKFYYSNPTASQISFQVDDKPYQVEPGKSGYLTLKPGEHSIQDNSGNTYRFFVYENNNGGILNPENFIYYTLSEVYVVKGKADQFKPTNYLVTINGYQLELPLRSTNAMLIDGNAFKCSYPLGEPFPAEIRTNNKNNDGNIKSKCFDKAELLQYFVSDYGDDLKPKTKEDEFNDSINMDLNYLFPQPDFTDPDIQAEAEKLTTLLNQIEETTDPNIHDKLKKPLYDAISNLSKAYGQRVVKDSVKDSEYYNHFVEESMKFQSYGILPRP